MTLLKKLISNIKTDLRSFSLSKYKWSNLDKQKIGWMFKVLSNPFETFNNIKNENKGSVGLANIVFLMLFITGVSVYSLTGFIFNVNQMQNFDLLGQFAKSNLIVLLWVVGSYSVSTIMDGEGSFRELWISTCYALIPAIIFNLSVTVISNFITIEENANIALLQNIGILWSGILLIIGIIVVQGFSLLKTLLSVFLSLVMVAFMMFIAFLFFNIFQQMYSFINTVITEITVRSW